MQGKFLKNLVLLLLLNLMIKPFWILGIDRSVQNTVGAESYGFYFAVFNFSFLLNILLDFGITNFNNRNIAQNNQLLTKHLSNILVLKLLLFVVYIAFTLGSALVIQYSPEQLRILYFLAINQFLLSFILYLRSNLGGLHLFRTDSLISILDRSLMILICGVLLWGNVVDEFRIQYYVYAQTAGYSLTALIALLLVLQRANPVFLRIRWNFPFLLAIIRRSFPYALLVLLMTFYNRIDSVMLERMLENGNRYSGIYAAAYRLFDATNMIALLFAVLLLPMFSRMIKQQQDIEQLVKLALVLLFTLAVIIAAGSVFYSRQIMTLLYPLHAWETAAEYAYRIDESSMVFALLMTAFMAVATSYVLGTLLTANASMGYLNLIAFAGVLLNVGLNLLLIPKLQASGSAWASLATQMSVTCLQLFVVVRLFRFRTNYLLLFRMTTFLGGTLLIAWLSLLLPFSWLVNFLFMVAGAVGLSLGIGLLSPRQFYQLIRYAEW